jgi:hypothetical protein
MPNNDRLHIPRQRMSLPNLRMEVSRCKELTKEV